MRAVNLVALAVALSVSSSTGACPSVATQCTPTGVETNCAQVQSVAVAPSATATARMNLPSLRTHVATVVLTGASASWTPTWSVAGKQLTITAVNSGGTTAKLTANVSFDYAAMPATFETGNLSQIVWSETNQPLSTHLIPSQTVARSGTWSLHAVCLQADAPLLGHNHRCQVGMVPWSTEAVSSPGFQKRYVLGEWWYGASFYIPSSWSDDDSSCSNCGTADHYHAIFSWHHDDTVNPGAPPLDPLYLDARDSSLKFRHAYGPAGVQWTDLWTGSLDSYKGAWHDFVVHANWSTDPAVGYITIWLDGVQVADYHDHTAHPNGGGVDYKAGLTYEVLESTHDVYIDEVRMIDSCGSYNEVVPRSP